MLQDTTTKSKYMLGRVGDFRNVYEHGLPNFWDEHGIFLSKNDYQEEFQERRNDTSTFSHLSIMIKGQDILNILEKYFNLLFMMKETILSLPSITHFFYLDLDADNRETLAVSFPANSI